MRHARTAVSALGLVAMLIAGACGRGEPPGERSAPAPAAPAPASPPPAAGTEASPGATTATAEMKGKAGSKISGTVTFTETANGVAVTAHLTGIEGSGPRGFHLHETGNCSAADFSSAGGHFNPTGAAHGAPDSPEHHAGDLGNVEVGADGTVHLERVSTMLTVASGPNSVVGRAVILHEKADDLTTQPTGNAGGRVACGVVISGEDGEAEPVAGEEEDGAKSASEPKPVA